MVVYYIKSKMTKNFDIDIPFVDFIGIYLLEKNNGYSKLGISLKEEYKNSWVQFMEEFYVPY